MSALAASLCVAQGRAIGNEESPLSKAIGLWALCRPGPVGMDVEGHLETTRVWKPSPGLGTTGPDTSRQRVAAFFLVWKLHMCHSQPSVEKDATAPTLWKILENLN